MRTTKKKRRRKRRRMSDGDKSLKLVESKLHYGAGSSCEVGSGSGPVAECTLQGALVEAEWEA